MAIVTRYFSTVAAGAGTGVDWANRAQLISGATWSTVLTSFDFSGTDSLRCYIEGGLTYSVGASLTAANWTNPPSAANPLWWIGCDSSGNQLAIPDSGWTSNRPAWTDTTLPTLNVTGNFGFTEVDHLWHLIKVTGSLRQGSLSAVGYASWCVIENSMANASAAAFAGTLAHNCVFKCSGSTYSLILGTANSYNCRVEGVIGSSGNRSGISTSNANIYLSGCTVVNCGGDAIVSTGSSVNQAWRLYKCLAVNCGGAGLKPNSTAAQVNVWTVENCMFTGNGTYGVDAQSAGRMAMLNSRLRDNTSGPVNGFGNYPDTLNNDTSDIYANTAAADAAEYVDSANGDYRIKYGSPIWGKGYGPSDEPAPVGGGSSGFTPMLVE